MNELYINLVIIGIIIVLFLAYILIGHFYNNYTNYKSNVNNNLIKTKDYINSTTTTLNTNIQNNKDNLDKTEINLNNKINSVSSDLNNSKNDITKINSNIDIIKENNANDSNNLTNFDRNFKQYFEFRSNNSNINDALYNHRFDVIPNLSLNVLRNITAVSGMTIKTDNTNVMRICDNTINNNNCIDMNITNGNFEIYPSSISNNNVNNINIYNKNKQKVLASFNLNSNNIYLGGNNDDAAVFINDSNVYFKNVNFLSKNAKFSDNKNIYDKNNLSLNQNYNTYSYNIDDIVKLNQMSLLITGIYTIIKGAPGTANTIIINLKSAYDIPVGKTIVIDVFELANTDNINTGIINTESSSSIIFQKGILNQKKISLTNSTLINANTNIRIKLTDNKLILPSTYTDTENYISNTISTTIT